MRAGKAAVAATVALWAAGPAPADPVGITREKMQVTVPTPDGPAVISRIQNNDNAVTGDWALTSRPCPPFCIQPIAPAEGVTTIGELELIALLQDPDAVVVDGRVRRDFDGGSIPGAVNIPYTEAAERLGELGCEPDFDGFDCANARPVALFCNGPWCGQSPAAARRMIAAGYPPEKIYYYRGGMQVWRLLGLTVTE